MNISDLQSFIIFVSNYFGSSPISSFVYENDALERRTERLDSDDNLLVTTNGFAYNHYSEVTNAIMSTNNYNFIMDDIGNRTEHVINDIPAEYENDQDSNNRYRDTYSTNLVYNKRYEFDLDGNMTQVTDYISGVEYPTWQYTWNGENRMVSATNTADGTYVTYKYDYQGRMFEKVTNGDTTRFIWNGNHIIAELSEASTNLYVWVNGEILTANLNGETVFYCHDANKNVTDLVDTSGDSVAHYEYSPFGVITEQSETLAGDNPFRFSNEYFDKDIQKVVFKRRILDPWLGKLLSRDPIGVQGGPNEYGICGNDLINYWDELGLVNIKFIIGAKGNDNDGRGINVYSGSALSLVSMRLLQNFVEETKKAYKKCSKKECEITASYSLSSYQTPMTLNRLQTELKTEDIDIFFLMFHGQAIKTNKENEKGIKTITYGETGILLVTEILNSPRKALLTPYPLKKIFKQPNSKEKKESVFDDSYGITCCYSAGLVKPGQMKSQIVFLPSANRPVTPAFDGLPSIKRHIFKLCAKEEKE